MENKPGANNQIAAEYVIKARRPTATRCSSRRKCTFVANPSLYPKLSYDPYKGFTPISGLMHHQPWADRQSGVPGESVKELIALAKQKPGEINYGTFGVGSSGHLNMELFETLAGIEAPGRPLQGRGAGAERRARRPHPDGVHQRGQRGAAMEVGQGQAHRGRRREAHGAAAGGSDRRGERVPGYEAVSWFGLFGPPGMPADVVTKINAEVRKRFRRSRNSRRRFLERLSFQSIAGSPEELTNYIKADEPKWRKVIQDAKVKGE